MMTFSMSKPSTPRKCGKKGVSSSPLLHDKRGGEAALISVARRSNRSPLRQIIARVICAMPELAEVEWYRKQWDAGRGEVIVDLGLHARKRVFRGTNARGLRERLRGEKFLSSTARGKRMLFRF